MPRSVPIALVGLGNVGRRVMQILVEKSDDIRRRYDLDFQVCGVADSSGAAIFHPETPRPTFGLAPRGHGLDLQEVLHHKQSGQGAGTLPKYGHAGMSARQMIERAGADALLEMSPTNLKDGEPGLSAVEAAIERGMCVVLANKGPLVLAYERLMNAAARKQARLAVSATVAGGLPTVNIGRRDLAGARIEKIEGVLNGTTNLILTKMADEGMSYADALALAQQEGHAETDPTLDVEGFDAAVKLLILAHTALDFHATLGDVERVGITGVTIADLARNKRDGRVTKLLCVAARDGEGYHLSVKPTALPQDHPMAGLNSHQMGVMYHTDTNGTIVATIEEANPM
ncbi:MAG: homoserine dehydrogenase, partial [Chloroflexi bacterium]|nr:homoserine dehydrogenase [Chloroflexota bacterium]